MSDSLERIKEACDKAFNTPITQPKFCFCCGGELREAGLGFISCLECSKIYVPYINEDDEQCLALASK